MKTNKETHIGIAVTLLGVFVFFLARKFPELPEGYPGPGLFPTGIGLGFFTMGLLLVYFSFRSSTGDVGKLHGKWIPAIALLIILTLFPFLKDFAGFFISIAIAIFFVGLLMKLDILKSLLTAALTTGFIYVIFDRILHVPL